MANSFTDKYKKRQPAAGDLNWDDEINQNQTIDDIIGAARDLNNRVIYGLAATDGGGLTVDFAAGRVEVGGSIFEISASTKTAVDDASARSVNYLYVDSSGVVQINQTAPTGVYAPIAIIDVNLGTIARIGDFRQQHSNLLADETLAEINKIIDTTANVVDVFLYDTSLDSDWGAWRERTEHTSWYNETLDTAERGGSRKFPAIVFIVAEATTVTIYDATNVQLPMWMVFTTGSFAYIRGDVERCKMLNGELLTAGGTSGPSWVSFIKDASVFSILQSADNFRVVLPLVDRNNFLSVKRISVSDSNFYIADNDSNDIAITVLPTAPTDQATGLPVSTIAFATDGAISVVTDGGVVWDITRAAGFNRVSFQENNRLFISAISSSIVEFGDIPTADVSDATWRDGFYGTGGSLVPLGGAAGPQNDKGVIGNVDGLTLLKEDPSTPADGMVNYLTKDYQSGWMKGDIKGAWLASTDDTDLVATELFDSSDFTDGSGGSSTAGESAGTITGTYVDDTIRYQNNGFPTVNGKTYIVTADLVSGSTVNFFGGSSLGSSALFATSLVAAGVKVVTFTAVSSTTYLSFTDTSSFVIDSVTCKIADADRSVNGNGLQVFGTVTKTAVETGAELVAYSGWAAAIYLEQPNNTDLDFGTGDFYMMGWADTSDPGYILSRTDDVSATTVGYIDLHTFVSTGLRVRLGGAEFAGNVDIRTGTPHLVTVVRRAGIAYLYIDSVPDGSVAASGTVTMANAKTRIGGQRVTNNPADATTKYSLWRMGAGDITAEQIKHIYETEKHLFQEDAACTLDGTSDAVAALALDDVKDLLYVGTGDGVSVFSGLNRVDYIDTTGVPTSDTVVAVSAANGAYLIGNDAEAVGYIPAANLREEIIRQEKSGETLEIFWFDGDTSETDFTLQAGWKPKFVYEAGLIVKEGSGEDYTITFDGFLYTVVFASAPAAVNIGVMAVEV